MPPEKIQKEPTTIHIGILNIMPSSVMKNTITQVKEALNKTLKGTNLVIKIMPLCFDNEEWGSKNRIIELKKGRYIHWSKQPKLDGIFISGANLEECSREDIKFNNELTQIINELREKNLPTFLSCFSSQFYLQLKGMTISPNKTGKITGIFPHQTNPELSNELLQIPHSHNNSIPVNELPSDIKVLASTQEEFGIGRDGSMLICSGHPEYGEESLTNETKRDLNKNPNTTHIPQNYFTKETYEYLRNPKNQNRKLEIDKNEWEKTQESSKKIFMYFIKMILENKNIKH